jgi:hypothetical protein
MPLEVLVFEFQSLIQTFGLGNLDGYIMCLFFVGRLALSFVRRLETFVKS